MKTVKILATILLVVFISSCVSWHKSAGLSTNIAKRPVPVQSGPMTRNPNSLGLSGPGGITGRAEGWKVKQKRTRKNPNSQGRLSKVNRRISFVEKIPTETIQIALWEPYGNP